MAEKMQGVLITVGAEGVVPLHQSTVGHVAAKPQGRREDSKVRDGETDTPHEV